MKPGDAIFDKAEFFSILISSSKRDFKTTAPAPYFSKRFRFSILSVKPDEAAISGVLRSSPRYLMLKSAMGKCFKIGSNKFNLFSVTKKEGTERLFSITEIDFYVDPVSVFSNVQGGYGIFAGYNTSEKKIVYKKGMIYQ